MDFDDEEFSAYLEQNQESEQQSSDSISVSSSILEDEIIGNSTLVRNEVDTADHVLPTDGSSFKSDRMSVLRPIPDLFSQPDSQLDSTQPDSQLDTTMSSGHETSAENLLRMEEMQREAIENVTAPNRIQIKKEDVCNVVFYEVEDDLFNSLIEALPAECRGELVRSTEVALPDGGVDKPLLSTILPKETNNKGKKKKKKPATVKVTSSDKIKTVTKHLGTDSDIDTETILSALRVAKRKYVKTEGKGNCLFESVLMQIFHPHEYTLMLFRRQVAYHVVKYHSFYYPILRNVQVLDEQSFESFARNIYLGFSYGDIHVLQIIACMWRMKITVVDPFRSDIRVWHDVNVEDSDIVIVYNGLNHYSGTINTEGPRVKVHGSKTVTLRSVLVQDVQSPRNCSSSSCDEDMALALLFNMANDQNAYERSGVQESGQQKDEQLATPSEQQTEELGKQDEQKGEHYFLSDTEDGLMPVADKGVVNSEEVVTKNNVSETKSKPEKSESPAVKSADSEPKSKLDQTEPKRKPADESEPKSKPDSKPDQTESKTEPADSKPKSKVDQTEPKRKPADESEPKSKPADSGPKSKPLDSEPKSKPPDSEPKSKLPNSEPKSKPPDSEPNSKPPDSKPDQTEPKSKRPDSESQSKPTDEPEPKSKPHEPEPKSKSNKTETKTTSDGIETKTKLDESETVATLSSGVVTTHPDIQQTENVVTDSSQAEATNLSFPDSNSNKPETVATNSSLPQTKNLSAPDDITEVEYEVQLPRKSDAGKPEASFSTSVNSWDKLIHGTDRRNLTVYPPPNRPGSYDEEENDHENNDEEENDHENSYEEGDTDEKYKEEAEDNLAGIYEDEGSLRNRYEEKGSFRNRYEKQSSRRRYKGLTSRLSRDKDEDCDRQRDEDEDSGELRNEADEDLSRKYDNLQYLYSADSRPITQRAAPFPDSGFEMDTVELSNIHRQRSRDHTLRGERNRKREDMERDYKVRVRRINSLRKIERELLQSIEEKKSKLSADTKSEDLTEKSITSDEEKEMKERIKVLEMLENEGEKQMEIDEEKKREEEKRLEGERKKEEDKRLKRQIQDDKSRYKKSKKLKIDSKLQLLEVVRTFQHLNYRLKDLKKYLDDAEGALDDAEEASVEVCSYLKELGVDEEDLEKATSDSTESDSDDEDMNISYDDESSIESEESHEDNTFYSFGEDEDEDEDERSENEDEEKKTEKEQNEAEEVDEDEEKKRAGKKQNEVEKVDEDDSEEKKKRVKKDKPIDNEEKDREEDSVKIKEEGDKSDEQNDILIDDEGDDDDEIEIVVISSSDESDTEKKDGQTKISPGDNNVTLLKPEEVKKENLLKPEEVKKEEKLQNKQELIRPVKRTLSAEEEQKRIYLHKAIEKKLELAPNGKLKCPLKCPATFASKYILFEHVDEKKCVQTVEERLQSGSNVYVCPECGHRNLTRTAAIGHLNRHKGAKPYTCSICFACYAQSSSLSNHKVKAHPELFPVKKRSTPEKSKKANEVEEEKERKKRSKKLEGKARREEEKEKEKRRQDEEKEKRKREEEKEKRRQDEEKEKQKREEEKETRRRDEEKEKRRRDEEKEKRRLNEEKEKRRQDEEKKKRRAKEEKEKRRRDEEKEERKRAEEKRRCDEEKMQKKKPTQEDEDKMKTKSNEDKRRPVRDSEDKTKTKKRKNEDKERKDKKEKRSTLQSPVTKSKPTSSVSDNMSMVSPLSRSAPPSKPLEFGMGLLSPLSRSRPGSRPNVRLVPRKKKTTTERETGLDFLWDEEDKKKKTK